MLKHKNLYKKGLNRKQALLFPPSIDEYVSEDNSARAIDVYVDSLDLSLLGFTDTRRSYNCDGNKAYHPNIMLKIYVYGYLNKIRSSRNLERECKRNVELIFLTSGLQPGYHTISDFRKNNPKALKEVFKDFTLLCKNLDLFQTDTFAVDGTFFKANASKNTLLLKSSIEKKLEKIDEKIENYLQALDTNDKENSSLKEIENLPKTIDELKEKRKDLQSKINFLEKNDLKQFNTTDKDAKLMKKSSQNLMAYNSQIVVDSKFKFIVSTDVINIGNDGTSLHNMAKDTKQILQKEEIKMFADTGYYSTIELKKCVDDTIDVYMPIPEKTKELKQQGKFTREDFTYDIKNDCYICPNDKILKKGKYKKIRDNGRVEFTYFSLVSDCNKCNLRDKCLSEKAENKKFLVWEHEHILINHKEKMQTKKAKKTMRQRASFVEHPFGTIKRILGWDHFLVRGLRKVRGENALIMLTYNLKRLLNVIGISMFKELIFALKTNNKMKLQEIRERI